MSLWRSNFTATVLVYHYTGTNDQGDTLYDPSLDQSGVQLPCRLEHTRKEVLDAAGQQMLSEATVYSDVPIAPLSIVVADGHRYTAKSCQPITGLYGQLDHYEIYL